MTQPITSFTGKYRWLSNFSITAVKDLDIWFPTVEHAYQYAKQSTPAGRAAVMRADTPGAAKRAARRFGMRPDWDVIKVNVMRQLLWEKFKIPTYQFMLLATGDAELIEGNTWGDRFWGVCDGIGENHLGRLLMEIREDLRRASSHV